MTKFKKITAFALSACAVICAVSLAACDSGDNQTEVKTEVKTEVTDESAWASAFDTFDYTNLSILLKNGENEKHVYLDENGVYITGYPIGFDIYSIHNSDGTYSSYVYNIEKKECNYTNEESDTTYVKYKSAATLKISFADYYQSFTYNEGVYRSKDEIHTTCPAEDEDMVVVCRNIVVEFSNDEIVSLQFEYYFADDNEKEFEMSLKYYDVGKTVVTVPQEVLDHATSKSDNE